MRTRFSVHPSYAIGGLCYDFKRRGTVPTGTVARYAGG